MPGEIISEPRATSNRNTGRHHRGFAGDFPRNPQAGSTHHARRRSDQEPPPPGGPRFGQPGRPTREWSGRLAQTRGQDRQDYVQHGRGRPSVGETPANTVDVFLASAAPLARDSGCPPNRVNPKVHLLAGDPDDERVQRIVLAALRPEPIREPKEILLVDRA